MTYSQAVKSKQLVILKTVIFAVVMALSCTAMSMLVGADPASKHIIWWNSNKGPKDISVQDLENASAAFDGFVVQNVRGSKDTFASNMSLAWGAFTTRHYTLDSSDS